MKRKPALEFLGSIDPDSAQSMDELRKICPDLLDALTQHLYGELYQRDKLTLRERLLITIGALMASGQMAPQLSTQIALALKQGLTRDELMEVALQISAFFGFAHAVNAMLIVDGLADTMELLKASAEDHLP